MLCGLAGQHDDDPVTFRVEEAARELGMSRAQLYRRIKAGEIATQGEGRSRRISEQAIADFMAGSGGLDGPKRESVPATGAKRSVSATSKAKGRRGTPRRRPEGTRVPNGENSIYFSETDQSWHGWVTVGVLKDGSPDRRHRMSKSEKALRKKVKELTKARDEGAIREAGRRWRAGDWLIHWVENVVPLQVRDSTTEGYRTDVYKHLVPGLSKHWLDAVPPEWFEGLYLTMMQNGAKPATAHHVHRTARTAWGVACARGHTSKNPVALAKPPRIEEEEIEPYSLEEVQLLLGAAMERRNGLRWVLALVFGLRQGEALGLKWEDFDLDIVGEEGFRVRRNRLRPRYAHGCSEPCQRPYAGHCPARISKRPKTGPVKSKAGRRSWALPGPIAVVVRMHRVAQEEERVAAGDRWLDEGWVIATENGDAVNPRNDWAEWKELLRETGLRDGRLHDARHTAATLLLRAGIVERTTQSLMGWGDTRNAQRYQHVTGVIQRDAASRVGTLLWGVGELAPSPSQLAIKPSQTVSGELSATGSATETDQSH
ncbi:tyrosine-type recombinase/integrase [Catenulispora pinisilvae]|uniref:tyrosine-type recombinase/integrase n=1 Tax=Catenulispora pinisilvae TaxID=2705253 RepID=UPI001892478E|nr:tyrosine-type recombinase/integrase [Catenulispora pinisilvae]